MKSLKLVEDPRVESVFENYPNKVRSQMFFMRNLVLECAEEIEELSELEITLKWGEPSFISKYGSTLRMDWKEKSPDQYAMYFQCSSRLVETFKMVFSHTFQYEGQRAIVFQLDDTIPVEELKSCIKATLMYHKVKNHVTLEL